MSPKFSLPWPAFSFAFIFLSVLLLALEQAPAQNSIQTSQRASISMEQEHHHHLEFENSYVRVFFVEILAHESTLFHRHDFPYLSVSPSGEGGTMPPPFGLARREIDLPMVGYSPGNFSHAVSNSRDVALHNVAIELLRPQGNVRNGCEQAIRDQPHEQCSVPTLSATTPAAGLPLFETDEITVTAWYLRPNSGLPAPDARGAMLVAGLSGVTVTASGGITSANALKGGVLWLPAGSKPFFKAGPAPDSHLISITFKDSGPAEQKD
jgi:hypothetical protein